MLTEQLGKLRTRLREIEYLKRTAEEDKLLAELNALDTDQGISESFEKAEKRGSFKSYGGADGVCSQCQRPF